ncbi:uncharacterized protein LOC131858167 [Cryptomeria japonica]|uniref:uncharacterized protein LOC131858167 n=1 Tax=Cryptomeria japonica TaxID=3369 RepID=UPI0027DAB087|nr:uncharacterized protein LOC131858167 [Cryptomeria japonica]
MGKISEYERKRQENIERNEQMLAALRVLFAAQDLRSASKKPNGDNSVGLWSGLDSENVAVTYCYNPLLNFRVTWGWDDQYLFFGNKDKGLNAYCTVTKATTTLDSPFTNVVSTRLAKHPFCCGMLAAGGGLGKVHIWQNSKELLHNDNGR